MSQRGISMVVRQQIGRADPSSQVLVIKPPKVPGKGFKVKFRTVEQQLARKVDMDSVRAAHHALPYACKFFWMIYRLSPVRTIIIISVYILQGLLPALRLRTGGDFIRQVRCPPTRRNSRRLTLQLQEGIQSGTMNSRNLVRLAITQALTYILEQSAWTLLYSPSFASSSNRRHNMEDKTQHHLATEMEIALMKAHLRLDISQMMDKKIKDAFQRV